MNFISYFDTKIFNINGKKVISLVNENKIEYYVQKIEKKNWDIATPVIEIGAIKMQNSKYNSNIINSRFGISIGLMSLNNKTNNIVFKIKEGNKPISKGSTCSVLSKTGLIRKINDILIQIPKINNDMKQSYTTIDTKNIMQLGLCIICEILLRDMNTNLKQIWFMNEVDIIMYENILSQN